jgi:hypothetical protein
MPQNFEGFKPTHVDIGRAKPESQVLELVSALKNLSEEELAAIPKDIHEILERDPWLFDQISIHFHPTILLRPHVWDHDTPEDIVTVSELLKQYQATMETASSDSLSDKQSARREILKQLRKILGA